MSEKEFKEFRQVLKKQQEEVKTSKDAARKLLTELGILTPKGNLTKASVIPDVPPLPLFQMFRRTSGIEDKTPSAKGVQD